MKKTTILIIVVLFMIIGYAAYNTTINIYGNGKLAENLSDFKVYLSNLKVNGNEVSGINNTKDEFTINDINGDIIVDVINDSTEYDTESYLECELEDENTGKILNYDYTGSEQTFVAPATGTYKLETWGAQGGGYTAIGGYGGYSSGNVSLSINQKLYINVGEGGKSSSTDKLKTTYNGGGESIFQVNYKNIRYFSSGGGATSIATSSGLLSTLENSKSNILIVSGGGGGAFYSTENSEIDNGGSGGGYIGSNGNQMFLGWGTFGYGGTQSSGGYSLCNDTTCSSNNWKRQNYSVGGFGYGGYSSIIKEPSSGGGSGFYGGGGSAHVQSAGGGSGYIGNALLTEKSMYCYNCSESSEVSTKTISTTCTSSTPTENCAKSGNGYARVTLVDSTNDFTTDKNIVEALSTSTQKMENIKTKSLTCKLKVNKISRTEKKTYNGPTVWNYDYTGSEQTFVAPVMGKYKLETWGAQGGSYTSTFIGGYGGYAIGNVSLATNQKLYINVGGQGIALVGGYNGGGTVNDGEYGRAGGGATHIATKSGLLSSLENSKSNILIVSGGGGGAAQRGEEYGDGNGGSAGGYIGNNGEAINHSNGYGYGYGTGGNQNAGGQIVWIPGTANINSTHLQKSYGSFGYGGGNDFHAAGGGSGYIGNALLTNKSMYCYNCATSNETLTKTISTTCTSSTPTSACSKQGNGYARITLISID